MSNTDGEVTYNHLSIEGKLSYWMNEWQKADKEIEALNEQLKQKEDVIRELIPLARMFVVHKEWMGEECKTEKAIIEKAKSLTTKDK